MSQQLQAVYLIAANRTPVGKARGVFKHTRPDDLLVHALQGTLAKVPALDPAIIDDVIIGCAMPEGEQGMNVARIALLMAGLPDSVAGVTVNRFCASGIQSMAMAQERIATGQADVIIAGGTESMTKVPLGGFHFRGNPAWFEDSQAHANIAFNMGVTAEKVAAEWGISREAQDAFSFESHQRALRAIDNHEFKDEIIPVTLRHAYPDLQNAKIIQQQVTVTQDEGPRADTS